MRKESGQEVEGGKIHLSSAPKERAEKSQLNPTGQVATQRATNTDLKARDEPDRRQDL